MSIASNGQIVSFEDGATGTVTTYFPQVIDGYTFNSIEEWEDYEDFGIIPPQPFDFMQLLKMHLKSKCTGIDNTCTRMDILYILSDIGQRAGYLAHAYATMTPEEVYEMLFPKFASVFGIHFESFNQEIALPVIDLIENFDKVLANAGMTVPDYLYDLITNSNS